MLGDGGQNFSHERSRSVGHLDQLFEFLPRFSRIDRFSRESESILNRRGASAYIDRSGAVEQNHISGRTWCAVKHAPHDRRAFVRATAVSLFQSAPLQTKLIRFDRVFLDFAIA